MNYSEMTDFEINIEVAKATGHKPLNEANGWKGLQDPPFSAVICKGPRRIGGFDPCNSWADSGPIIQKYGISLHYIGGGHERGGWGADDPSGEKYTYNDNPLRAAMIVLLMMQEKPDAA